MIFDVLTILLFISSCISLIWLLVNQVVSPIYEIKDAILKRKIKKNQIKIEDIFKVSVIVPAWNEAVGIKDTLRSLFNSDYNNLEVIVVDDGSKDETTQKVIDYYEQEFIPKYYGTGKTLGLFQHPTNAGKGEALNTGIRESCGDIIITVDGDSVFEVNTIYEMVKYFIDPKIHAVEGNIKVTNNKNFLGLLQKVEYQTGCYFKRAFSVLGCEYVMPGPVSAFRREVFEKVGMLDKVCKTEDLELTFRVRKNGLNVYYAEDAVVWTEGASTFSGLVKQRVRWKKGRIDAMLYHHDMFFSFDRKINKFLSFFVFPFIILFDEVTAIMPVLFTTLIILLSKNCDIYIIAVWFVMNAIYTLIPVIFGHKNANWKVALLSPFFFALYYVISFIETYALLKSIGMVLKGKDVKWQNWQRKGVLNV